MTERLLIALDIDGTILDVDGEIPDATRQQVKRLRAEGHEVMLATGRSAADMLPVRERLSLDSRYLVSANGAMVLERAEGVSAPANSDYAAAWVETFDPTDALIRLRPVLRNARFAVEGPDGVYRYSGQFPDGSFEAQGTEVKFEDLLGHPVTRLVVVSPDHSVEEFVAEVKGSGLHQVTYSVGWSAWLDIAPEGVNKATALEKVRTNLGISGRNVVVAGDGFNDIQMLEWAKEIGGRSFAMGNAPQQVIDAASDLTTDFYHDGLALALAKVGYDMSQSG
ncbi:Cof-type HAD-IIB family hydrolase [Gulosibacter sp. ACHW.36C]|jgi:Cof subfamily protein (haloacid dehalogenase superfamily)|uniref:Cof-type HAD-IIB family hydrolase n=1 Tax=Gulosibacter sediminis TaxID=1729695 RepID=A0ABY4MZJ5_9MICO|nr:Cof-type HAD-IIB family hydrolase [Gulosibacter sediminis]UQN14648.1 Cof-type HAD-IIB family hydrolase [Gulosibacter sediminis]